MFEAQDAVRTFATLHRHGRLSQEESVQWAGLCDREREAVLALRRTIDTDVAPDQRPTTSWALRKAARGKDDHPAP
ncbi:hypothetical protein [Yinghuangia sp. YIM S09857]|uniref:hypothetical protein n=1 Tax=Yinghuangia sp. YIM S09857 TaxID=3436929 RepID=UPI003F52FD83